MKLSVVIPGNNEEGNIEKCARVVSHALKNVDYELVLVNDCSKDKTGTIIDRLARNNKRIKAVHRTGERGFGKAVKAGYKKASGDYVALVMADLSDDPKDLMKMWKKALEGYDVVVGNRFAKGAIVEGYPFLKMVANRMFNILLSIMFRMPYKDISNAFKMYKKEIVKQPLDAEGFDITIEAPIKAWIAGYKFAEVPNNWYGRQERLAEIRQALESRQSILKTIMEII